LEQKKKRNTYAKQFAAEINQRSDISTALQ